MTTTAAPAPAASRARLRSDVRLAARVLPTHYPLETFIAVNPLAGMLAMPFEQAARRAGDLYGMRGTLPEHDFRTLYSTGRITDADLDRALLRRHPNLADEAPLVLGGLRLSATELLRADLLHGHGFPDPKRRYHIRAEQLDGTIADHIDTQTAKWCAAFFGAGGWPMPGRESGFYRAWRALAPRDRTLHRAARAALAIAPERPDDLMLAALDTLGVPDEARITYLQAHLTRLPGWAAHVQYCGDTAEGIDLVDYLAMRLAYEAALLPDDAGRPTPVPARPTPPTARQRLAHLLALWNHTCRDEAELTAASRILALLPVTTREMIWQNAFEDSYRDRLLTDLAAASPLAGGEPPHTQLVTCIDTRSEGLRRHLEKIPGYDTYGFAGFFAVAIRYTDLLGGASADLCPVLISPAHDVAESVEPANSGAAARRIAGAHQLAGAESAFHAAKDSIVAPYALAEAAGWVAGPLAAAKTFMPAATGTLRRRLHDLISPPAPTHPDVDAMPLQERVLFAEVMLTAIGLTTGFGRLLVLCGHGSTSENNPYQAALDCGACGGQTGGPNARTAAHILNQAEVRDELRRHGIDIPDHTVAVAALHDTTTDRITVLDVHAVPATHHTDIDRLTSDLSHSGAALAAERATALPGSRFRKAPAAAAKRSVDWAQVYPEWGLAGNAAMVIAPRTVTRGIDLHRRVFLHSYDAGVDPDGAALETILTAPLVVAHWINSQYYFSTVAPEVFGAGTKTIHNVVGTAGVIAGHTGDLRLGLPAQSIAVGARLMHEPQRLLAVVQAPYSRIDTIVARNPILQQLFGNGWISVAARESPDQPWQRWTRAGWRLWNETERLSNDLAEVPLR